MNNGNAITPEMMNGFSSGLKNLVSEIFDDRIDFVQTPDTKRCEKCPYNAICQR
jgi:hypothetical protein